MWRWIGVVVCAWIAHLGALRGGFVWLDHAHIEEKLAIVPLSDFGHLFTQGFAGTGFYRPLMALSLSLDALIGGAFVHHATNLAWHAAAAVMVVLAADALGLARRAATIAGVLFAVHPVAELPANLIAFRSEAMVTVALLGLIVFHVRGNWLAAAGALLAGALTKEVALILGPMFVVALEIAPGGSLWEVLCSGLRGPRDRLPPQPRDDRTLRRRRVLLAEGLALAVALGLRLAFAPSWRASHEQLGAMDAIGTRFAVLAKGAGALLFPVDRRVCDAFVVTHVWQLTSLLGIAVAVTLARLAWTKRGPALLLTLAILPAMQLVPIMRWWSPHYFYLPLAFAAMLAAVAVGRLGRRAYLAEGAVVLLFMGLSIADSARFRDDASLWRPEVAAQPACREGQFYLAEIDRNAKRFAAAAKKYEAALAAWPGVLAYIDRGAALQNLGAVLVELRRFADARGAFRTALTGANDPATQRELVHNLAGATLSDGDAGEAARLLEPWTSRADALPESIALHALALEKLGRHEEARALTARLPPHR